jgi:P4 family phage/plasmid primase-like protien
VSESDSHKWAEVDGECPGCQRHGWCQRSADGAMLMCRRNATGAFVTKTDAAGVVYHLHRLIKPPDSTPPVAAERLVEVPELADVDTRHEVYSAMLEILGLDAGHYQALLDRGLAPEQISGRGYRTLVPNHQIGIAAALHKRFGTQTLLQTPGLFVNGRGWLSVCITPGLLIPVRDVERRIVALSVRPDKPTAGGGKYRWASSKRHKGPGPGAPPHVPLGANRTTRVWRLTEGVLKADVATALSGIPAIGAPGSGNWRRCLQILKAVGCEIVRLAFDADAWSNPHVGRAQAECYGTLKAEGFAVEIEQWEALVGKGIDDVLAAGGMIEVLAGADADRVVADATPKTSVDPCRKGIAPGDPSPPGNTNPPSATPDRQPLEGDKDPHRLARVVLADHTDGRGNPLLVHFQEQYLRHDGTCYRVDPFFAKGELIQTVKADLDRCNLLALERFEREAQASGRPTARRPVVVPVTRSLAGDVNQALASIAGVDRLEEPPFWIDRQPGDPDPFGLIPAQNGLINVERDPPEILPHTPRLFSLFTLPFEYNPDAPEPENWLKLLNDQWGEDQETVAAIHEVIGYLLTPDTRMQRIFLWIGPPRSGRGTMREVITGLIGPRNIASTSAVSLGGPFGLEPLLGRSVAIMGDARTGDSHDTAILLDRLLRISGCDPVEVNRKSKVILPDIRMRTRFLIISNEMPNFRDASGAIASRYHIIKATRTIPPEDRDPGLAETILREELPGILNLAIAARSRLYGRGRFTQPESALDLLEDAQELASPVKRFVDECYDFDPNGTEPTSSVFTRWKSWATEHNYPIGNEGIFGKNLKAAYPAIKKVRPREGTRQVSSYAGISGRL